MTLTENPGSGNRARAHARNPWTPHEDNLVLQQIAKDKHLAAHLRRSIPAVRSRRAALRKMEAA
jgi:hypothetical protein